MKLIVANWKENPENIESANKLVQTSPNLSLVRRGTGQENKVLFAVPNVFASELVKEFENEKFILQDISKFENGSHTGEVSYKMAKNIGVAGSIVGHSERRGNRTNIQGDRDEDINQKLKNLLNNDLLAILCTGEANREEWKKMLELQIKEDLKNIEFTKLEKLIVAYEPIWAIGNTALRAASKQEIEETLKFIKTILPGGKNIKVLYGGSVDEKNIKEILEIEDCDGVLIGRASSDLEKWKNLLDNLV